MKTLTTLRPPDLGLGFSEDTGGQPQSVSEILLPGEKLIAGFIATRAETPGSQIGDIEGSLILTALAILTGIWSWTTAI